MTPVNPRHRRETEWRAAVTEALVKQLESGSHQAVIDQLAKTTIETVIALADAIELKDPYTKGHCTRVRDCAILMARHIGLPRELLHHLIFGALLHDCGKIGIRDGILLSGGPLGPSEWVRIKHHSVLGFELTRKVDHLKTASRFIRQHHERFDGTGYPDGLSGERSHICSRILTIVDAFDAMTSDRPYRRGMDAETAKQQLRQNMGTQFDPKLVGIFLEALTEKTARWLRPCCDRSDIKPMLSLLVVDDDAQMTASIVRSLMDEGYRIATAENGRQALDRLKQCGADLILCDVRMPEMNGVEFLKRSRRICPNAVRIMMSGHSDFSAAVAAVNEAGVYKFLVKPWREEELKTVLQSAVEWVKTYLGIHAPAPCRASA